MSYPILSSKFFDQHKPDLGFFTKWSSLFTWSNQILPVYQWQDVLYVGCVLPPENFPKFGKQKVVFVLCEPRALQDLWLDFQATPPVSEVAEPPVAPAPPSESEFDPDRDLFVAPTAPVSLSAVSPDSPESLLLDESTNFNLNAESAAETELLDLSASESDAAAADFQAKTPSTSLALMGEGELETAEESTQPIIELKDDNKANARIAGSITQEIANSNTMAKIEPWLEKIFRDNSKHFDKTMLLLKMGDQIKPWKWDLNFKAPASGAQGVSLVQPSPFRIVTRTKKPYHGYLVKNDISEKFFKEWNNAQMPEHLTLVPILVDDHVIGMLLSTGKKAADTKENLLRAESLGNEIAEKIKSQPKSLQAA